MDSIFRLVNYFHEHNIPYNIMFTYHERGCCEVVTAFIFPRMEMASVKDYSNLNIACCELSGFFNVGSKYFVSLKFEQIFSRNNYNISGDEMYNSLTEEIILEKFNSEIGEVPDLDDKIKDLFKTEWRNIRLLSLRKSQILIKVRMGKSEMICVLFLNIGDDVRHLSNSYNPTFLHYKRH